MLLVILPLLLIGLAAWLLPVWAMLALTVVLWSLVIYFDKPVR